MTTAATTTTTTTATLIRVGGGWFPATELPPESLPGTPSEGTPRFDGHELGEDVYICELPLGVKFPGFHLVRSALGQFVVKTVHAGTWCAKVGICERDELLKIGDYAVSTMSQVSFRAEMAKRPLRLLLRAASGKSQTRSCQQQQQQQQQSSSGMPAPPTSLVTSVGGGSMASIARQKRTRPTGDRPPLDAAAIALLQNFARCVARHHRTWDAAFRYFDTNASGLITQSEFYLQSRKLPGWSGDTGLVFDLLDVTGNRELREDEFEVLHNVFDEFREPGVKNRERDHFTHTMDIFKLVQPLLEPTSFKKHSKDILRTLEFAFKKGTSPHDWLGPGVPLSAAVEAAQYDLAALLLRYRADPNANKNDKGVSLLHLAVHRNQENMVNLLLAYGAEVNATDMYSQTPLCFASTRSMCSCLLGGRADLALVNHRGQSALHLCCQAGRADVAHFLASKASRAIVELRDAHGFKAIDHARSAGLRLEVLQLLAGPQVAQGGIGTIMNFLDEEMDSEDECLSEICYPCLVRELDPVPMDPEASQIRRLQLKAVLRLQAWRRGVLARRSMLIREDAAVKLQAKIRATQASKELAKQKAAVQKIQALQRGHSARMEIQPQLRGAFITEIFCALDVEGVGHLSSEALLRYTTICGFDGDRSDWDEEYDKLCKRYDWDPALGPDCEGFAEHLNDDSHHGHMEDHELKIVYDELLEEATPEQDM
mmetsp:Transcript_77826/g.161695  ORF Transcript_77826/g.161695 Transcript_77826/m.161695 type:complete len:712 (-) Transcript_77826:47-2182(-)